MQIIGGGRIVKRVINEDLKKRLDKLENDMEGHLDTLENNLMSRIDKLDKRSEWTASTYIIFSIAIAILLFGLGKEDVFYQAIGVLVYFFGAGMTIITHIKFK